MPIRGLLIYLIIIFAVLSGVFAGTALGEGTSFDDAQQITEGTYTGTINESYYYRVDIPAYKSILVTLTSGINSSVDLEIYDQYKQDTGVEAYAENGSSDTAFYDGKFSVQYTVYLVVDNFSPIANYTISVEFRPGDVMTGAQNLTNGQSVNGVLKADSEVHWYKIYVPEGKLLNVSFSSEGGDLSVTIYNANGFMLDSRSGTSGYVSTELIGGHGTMYVKVESSNWNGNISYTITPHLKTGKSTLEQVSFYSDMVCLISIVALIAIIIIVVVLIIKYGNK